MIVHVAPGRRDGKSSFEKLSGYISDGISQSGESPLKSSWNYLTQYITKESVLNELGDNVEKTIAVEIGHLESLKTAPHEMRAVATQNIRQKDPVYHYILSWPESEHPKTEDIFAAARHSLKALGMQDHQYIVAIHANTDNLHAHIEVNRIHPKTFRAARLEWAHATLHKAARESELMFGWQHDNGIFQVVDVAGKKMIVRSKDYIDPELAGVRGAANRYETWSGDQSLETWCKDAPATDLKTTLADPKTTSWQDLHRVLAHYGLELRDSGGGGMKVFDVSDAQPGKEGKQLVVSASKAFRFMKRADLEKQLGPFEAISPDLVIDEPQKTYKRDPQKRLDRRLARKALREDLHSRYQEEMRAARENKQLVMKELSATFGSEDRKRLQVIDQHYKEQRTAIRINPALSASQKQQAYMLAKLTVMKAREQVKTQIKSERAERRELLPVIPSWREWVEQQAQLGDEAAISALRGLIYQEKRDEKKVEKAAAHDENAILPAEHQNTDPYVRAIQNIVWKVSKNGRVTYAFKNGEDGFVDEGEKLTFGRKLVSDEALMVTLRYAADKWGGNLQIAGGDAAFKERVARMALQNGIEIKNPELQELQRQIRAELAHTRKVQAVPEELPKSRSSSHDETPIDVLIRRQDDKAFIQHAVTQAKTYSGRIVAENAKFIAQHVGKNGYILHEKAAFKDTLPVFGQKTIIRYQSGSAKVQEKVQRGRGGK